MNLIDLTPGVTVLLHGRKRTVERVAMHPSSPVVIFRGTPFARKIYSFAELVREGAEVVA